MALGKISSNLANGKELKSLPGIWPRTAKAIIEYKDTVGSIDEHTLSSIPYIRISRELLDLLDFSMDCSVRITRQQAEIDRFTDTIDRANLRGPSFNLHMTTDLPYPSVGASSPNSRCIPFSAPLTHGSRLSLSAPAHTH